MDNVTLNSIHLHAVPRCEDFRRARAVLLRARGDQTIAAERAVRQTRTEAIPTKVDASPPTTRYVLVERNAVRPLKVGLNVMGRFSDSDVILNERHISRRHCAIVVHANSGCELHDLASRNGTLLNGERLTHPVWLVSGDQITVCDHCFTFLSADDLPEMPADDGHTHHD